MLRQPSKWPAILLHHEKHKPYQPHHDAEAAYVFRDTPQNLLAKGGEGSGKSVAGIIKDLHRLRRGMSGIMVSPDFEHFKKSLWQEFRRWVPLEAVVEKDRYRLAPEWEASKQFELHFYSEPILRPGDTTPTVFISTLYCGGIEDPSGWEGPNVNFAHFDEARRHKNAAALKVLSGRVRIPGPRGEPPQLWLTTTPRKHWLFDYFGGIDCECPACGAEFKGDNAIEGGAFDYVCPACGQRTLTTEDERVSFKQNSYTVTLKTQDNETAGNVSAGYSQQRGQSLTEAEKRVLLEGGWEDIETTDRFLPSLTWWDACKDNVPPLDRNTPLVFAADAGVSNDCFALVGVSRDPARPKDAVMVRYVRVWQPRGVPLDFDVIENEIRETVLGGQFNVKEMAYDQYQLHQMMTRLGKKVWTRVFSQGADRQVADKQLLDLITARKVLHDGNKELRAHIDNADRKSDGTGKLRIVKRSETQKVDLAVALSMAVAECLRLNL